MNLRQRVDRQPAYVLHGRPFRETSLIVEVFSRDFGRVALLAKGARRPRAAIRGLLMAFQPLELGWAGKGEVLTLMKAEWQGGQPLLSGQALFCGYYLNELLLKLLPREDAHEGLFQVYGETLQRISQGLREADLRHFEKALLQELGYGLNLEADARGEPIAPQRRYRYEIEHGAVPLESGEGSELCVSGQSLLDLAREDWQRPRSRSEAKQLMRALIGYYLEGRPLESRKIFKELQEL